MDDWKNEPDSCLALIIILDQFSRNLFRESTRAFENDEIALSTAKHAISKGFLDELNNDQKLFALLPFVHSEKIEDHILAIEHRKKFLNHHPRYNVIVSTWDDHRVAIEKFGRYPHRNKVRGLVSNDSELEFLSKPNSSW